MQGEEKGKEENLGRDSGISGKSRAGCRASAGEGEGQKSRILGLLLRLPLFVWLTSLLCVTHLHRQPVL